MTHINNQSVAIKNIHRIKVPTPARRVLAIVSAIPAVAITAVYAVIVISDPEFLAYNVLFGIEAFSLAGANLFASYGLSMKWFETSYEWKLQPLTLEEIRGKYGDRIYLKESY